MVYLLPFTQILCSTAFLFYNVFIHFKITLQTVSAECLLTDREQSTEGAAQTAGEPELIVQQPDAGTAATHHCPAGAEFSITYTNSKTTGEQQNWTRVKLKLILNILF